MSDKGRRIVNMVLAFLVSVGAWIFVIYNYEPMTVMTYNDCQVVYTGEEALAERGLAVSDVSSEAISVSLNQKRVDAGRISSDDIKVLADVSECSAGDNNVSLTVTGPAETTVSGYDSNSINVNVGRAKHNTMDIKVVYGEGAEDDAEPIATDLSQLKADVACTSERLAKVDCVAAVLDPEEVKDDVKSFTCKLAALDSEGEAISNVVIYPDEISLDARAGYKKTVSLTVPVKNKNSESYTRTYVAPEAVTIKGSREDVEKVGTIRALEADISDIYESDEIEIEYNLPEGIYIADESLGQKLNVTVVKNQNSGSDDQDSSDQ